MKHMKSLLRKSTLGNINRSQHTKGTDLTQTRLKTQMNAINFASKTYIKRTNNRGMFLRAFRHSKRNFTLGKRVDLRVAAAKHYTIGKKNNNKCRPERRHNNYSNLSSSTRKDLGRPVLRCNGNLKPQKRASSTSSSQALTPSSGTSLWCLIRIPVAKRPCLRRIGWRNLIWQARSTIETRRVARLRMSNPAPRLIFFRLQLQET